MESKTHIQRVVVGPFDVVAEYQANRNVLFLIIARSVVLPMKDDGLEVHILPHDMIADLVVCVALYLVVEDMILGSSEVGGFVHMGRGPSSRIPACCKIDTSVPELTFGPAVVIVSVQVGLSKYVSLSPAAALY